MQRLENVTVVCDIYIKKVLNVFFYLVIIYFKQKSSMFALNLLQNNFHCVSPM